MAKILIKNGRVWDGQKFLEADVLTDEELVEKSNPTFRKRQILSMMLPERSYLRVLWICTCIWPAFPIKTLASMRI